jgi:hypothetical protein
VKYSRSYGSPEDGDAYQQYNVEILRVYCQDIAAQIKHFFYASKNTKFRRQAVGDKLKAMKSTVNRQVKKPSQNQWAAGAGGLSSNS